MVYLSKPQVHTWVPSVYQALVPSRKWGLELLLDVVLISRGEELEYHSEVKGSQKGLDGA